MGTVDRRGSRESDGIKRASLLHSMYQIATFSVYVSPPLFNGVFSAVLEHAAAIHT